MIRANYYTLREPLTGPSGVLYRPDDLVLRKDDGTFCLRRAPNVVVPAHIVTTHNVAVIGFTQDSDGELDAVYVNRRACVTQIRADVLHVPDVGLLPILSHTL